MVHPTILERLERGDVLVSDGATGTYLQARGLEPGGCPEAFNVDQPELIKRMAAGLLQRGVGHGADGLLWRIAVHAAQIRA